MPKKTIKFSTEVSISSLVIEPNPIERRKKYDYAKLKNAGFLVKDIISSVDKGLVRDVFVTEYIIESAVT